MKPAGTFRIFSTHIPKAAETYIALAEIEAKTGRAAAAEAVLLKGVQAVAADPEIAVALARLQLSIGEA